MCGASSSQIATGSRIATGLAALVLCTSMATTPAHSQSARQFWRNEYQRQHDDYQAAPGYYRNDGYGNRGYDNGYGSWSGRNWGYQTPYYGPEQDQTATPRYANPPHVEVSSPKYYDYQPDHLQAMTSEKLCQTRVAANAPAAPIPGAAPAAPPAALPGTVPTAPALAANSFAKACALSPTMTLRVLPQVGKALTDYYSAHQQFIWSSDGEVNARARQAMKALADSGRYGLVPADYQVALPPQGDGTKPRPQDLLHFDLALSAKVLTYVLDATRGRVDANRISGYHDIVRKKPDLVAALGAVAQSDDVAAYLAQRNPDNAPFRAMVAALQKLRADTPREPVHFAADTVIRPGNSSPALIDVMTALRRHASPELKRQFADTLAGSTPKTYSGKLVDLVRAFQQAHNLSDDGVVGPKTIAAMTDDTAADKIEKLRLAMERMRWLPRKLGKEYVFLNEPAYQVTYVESDGQRLTMPVVVGKTSRQTYFFTDKIEAVEFNPYWDVPRSIVINEMLPHLYRDPSYLDRHGYQVINARGRQVSSASVDWAAYARNKVSVEVRQPPGPRNALGRLKIKFPNKHAIYMHDTPEKQLFAHAQRAFSHGCVRLKQPRVMAAALLGKPVSYVDRRIAAGDNDVDPISADIPVYLTYFTAWPDADGAMRYYADIYDRDTHLADALKKTEQARRDSH